MNLLARLDPGSAVVGQVFIFLLQTSVVIVLAALWSRNLLRRRAEARHALWLGTLVVVVVSPVVAAVAARNPASRSGRSLCRSSVTGRARRWARSGRVMQGSRADVSRLVPELFAGSVSPEGGTPPEAVAILSAANGSTRRIAHDNDRVIPRRQCPHGWADTALGGRCSGRRRPHRRRLDVDGGALSVGIGPRSRASWLDAQTRPKCARRVGFTSRVHVCRDPGARRGRSVASARHLAKGHGGVAGRRLATRRSRSRVCPCSSARRMGWPAAAPGRRDLLAAPAGSLRERPAHAGSRGNMRQPRAPLQ